LKKGVDAAERGSKASTSHMDPTGREVRRVGVNEAQTLTPSQTRKVLSGNLEDPWLTRSAQPVADF
jgi:hypothetical protein